MSNELLLGASVLLCYGSVLLLYRLFGKSGLYAWTVFAALAANIEVLILVRAFGMEQTLGNVLFASTFVVTDILSENYGKKAADTAVRLGIVISVLFIPVSRLWLAFSPSENDFIFPSVQAIFSNTPRLMLASLLVYALCQGLDVFLYHKIWERTAAACGDRKKFLWLRNNAATLISQLVNAVCFNLAAFAGIYEKKTLITVIASTYIIYAAAALLDTPAVYLARRFPKEDET